MSEEAIRWNERYQTGEIPWDTGRPSSELMRVVAEEKIQPCRGIELGCGTGTNAVWLAGEGFDMTAVDLSPLAIAAATKRAAAAGVKIRFLEADVLQLPDLGPPFSFIFDRGCYHAVRRIDLQALLGTYRKITNPGSMCLFLTGNAKEPHDPGPPVVTEDELRAELGQVFQIVRLREFRFDPPENQPIQFLGWSCLVKRRVNV